MASQFDRSELLSVGLNHCENQRGNQAGHFPLYYGHSHSEREAEITCQSLLNLQNLQSAMAAPCLHVPITQRLPLIVHSTDVDPFILLTIQGPDHHGSSFPAQGLSSKAC